MNVKNANIDRYGWRSHARDRARRDKPGCVTCPRLGHTVCHSRVDLSVTVHILLAFS